MKKTLVLAMIAVFAFAGMAFAADRVEVKVTSEPIQFQSLCDKGGGFTLEFDSDSTLVHGDQITIDLDFGVTLCRGIDLEISAGGNGGFWTNANVPLTGAPVTYTSTAPGVVGNGVYFRLLGLNGSQRITLSVVGGGAGDALVVGSNIDDKIIIGFLRQFTNDDFTTDGIYVDIDGDDAYTDDATVDDNTLCINVSQWDENTVNANMDSLGDKFTFIPSNPQIAHVVAAIDYAQAECEKIRTGRIAIGSEGDQGIPDQCSAFDWDDNIGYCFGTHTSSNLFVMETVVAGTFYQIADYQVEMEILTEGVYWTNEVVRAEAYSTVSAACAERAVGNPVGDQINYTYDAPPVDRANTDCQPTGATVLLTDCDSDMVLSGNNRAVAFNIPALAYNIAQIQMGAEVMIEIELIKCPCGVTWSTTLSLGTIGCIVPGESFSLLYPYATAMSGDGWWDGFVVINTGGNAGEATLYFWEKDGDQGQMVVAVPANADGGMFVDTLANMFTAPVGGQVVQALTQIGGDGVLGDAQLYIVACTDFPADGFMFMGDWTLATKKGQSMGYLPRTDRSLCGGSNDMVSIK